MSSSHASTSGPTAFRSHWSAPPQHGRTPAADMYDYDPNYNANQAKRQQPTSQSSNQSTYQSAGQSNNQRETVINLDGPSIPPVVHHPVNEHAPLLGQSHQSDYRSSNQSENRSNKLFGFFNGWASLCCCLLPLLVLILWILRYMMGDNHAAVLPFTNGHNAIAAQCDPFNFFTHSVDLKNKHGIVAYLSVVPHEHQSQAKSTTDFENKSERVNGTLFFSQLNTPTRLFTDRFVAHDTLESTHKNMSDSNQITLPSEFFFLDLHTRVLPPKKYREEDIQFAIICDDGCLVTQQTEKKQGDDEVLIDNDGIHSTRLAVADRPVYFENEPINLSIKYFQGPPAHIALYMLYRVWKNDSGAKSTDGEEGNDFFWNVSEQPNTESTPTKNFDRLADDEGWKVIPAEWFWLPKHYDTKSEVDALLAAGRDPCDL